MWIPALYLLPLLFIVLLYFTLRMFVFRERLWVRALFGCLSLGLLPLIGVSTVISYWIASVLACGLENCRFATEANLRAWSDRAIVVGLLFMVALGMMWFEGMDRD